MLKLVPVLEHKNPIDHFRQYGFEPIISDVNVEFQKDQLITLLKFQAADLAEMERVNVENSINEFFYALFFNYNETSMDIELKKLFDDLRQKYSSSISKNRFLVKGVEILLKSNNLVAKKAFMLMMIGSEENFQEHIRKIYRQNLQENKKIINPHLIEAKMERLLEALKDLVHRLTIINEPLSIHNVPLIIKSFLGASLNMYETGTSIPQDIFQSKTN